MNFFYKDIVKIIFFIEILGCDFKLKFNVFIVRVMFFMEDVNVIMYLFIYLCVFFFILYC